MNESKYKTKVNTADMCSVLDMSSALVYSAKAVKDYGLWSEKRNKVDYRDYFKDCITSNYRQIRPIIPEIKKVIFNDPATIVFWSNGEKTVVKCQEEDVFDPEKGLAMAITKMALGNKGNYFKEIKKWLPKQDEEERKPITSQEDIFEKIRNTCYSLDCLGFGFNDHDEWRSYSQSLFRDKEEEK